MEQLIKEFEIKKKRVIDYMQKKNIEAIFLNKPSNFFWLTCGCRNKVVDYSGLGASSLLIYKNRMFLITTNIEIHRMIEEETNNFNFIEPVYYNWYEVDNFEKKVRKIVDIGKIYQDVQIFRLANPLDNGFDKLKFCLTESEKDRYYKLGKITARCMTDTCRSIKPGMSEYEVQAILSKNLISKEVTPWVILIASDDRMLKYRHPIPTAKKIENLVMVVVGGLKGGLIACCTRILYFGKPSKQIIAARDIINNIDANLILSSRPGKKYCEIFKKEIDLFKSYNLENEWQNHHQSGPTGYEGRYFAVNSETNDEIEKSNAIAWNPSMKGFKSEDTFIVEENGNEIITFDDNWPILDINTEFGKIKRPDILIQ